MDDNHIITCTCDSCGRRGVGVLFHSNGTPVYFECKGCNPSAFEKIAADDVARYLAGAETTQAVISGWLPGEWEALFSAA